MDAKYKAQARGTFETKSWDEKTWDGQPWNEVSGAKLTHAHVTAAFQGDIQGESRQEWLMTYRSDVSANFVGLERVSGQIGGRSGSFVLQHNGTYENGVINNTFFVVPGCGTGELHNLRGQGSYIFDGQHGDPSRYTLDYDFE